MEYFKIGQDRRLPYSVMPEMSGAGGFKESKSGDISQLDDITVLQTDSGQENFYPDILDRQIFMIKGVVKDVFEMFLPGMTYKHCYLNEENKCEQYIIPELDILDIQTGVDEGLYIFRRADTKDIEVIISLEAAEAVLRRKPAGIRIVLAEASGLSGGVYV